MRVLVTGRGGAGSWIVRGEQLGAAMGATVKPQAVLRDMQEHDVILVVKKLSPGMLESLRASGKPWVYDIVDAYPQPACSMWSREQARTWLRDHLHALAPDVVVYPNRKMMDDAHWSGRVVYHHHRPAIKVHNPPERIRTVGYEGSAKYLDAWLRPIEMECQRRGLRFVLNPEHIADLDVVVAMRGGVWDGYAQRNWKSNVKLANAHGAGVPFIGARESGYEETSTGCEYWADTVKEFARALDWLEGVRARTNVHLQFLANPYPVEEAAAAMLQVLRDAM